MDTSVVPSKVPFLEHGDFEYPNSAPNWKKIQTDLIEQVDDLFHLRSLSNLIVQYLECQSVVIAASLSDQQARFSFYKEEKLQFQCIGNRPYIGQWDFCNLEEDCSMKRYSNTELVITLLNQKYVIPVIQRGVGSPTSCFVTHSLDITLPHRTDWLFIVSHFSKKE